MAWLTKLKKIRKRINRTKKNYRLKNLCCYNFKGCTGWGSGKRNKINYQESLQIYNLKAFLVINASGVYRTRQCPHLQTSMLHQMQI